MEKMTDQRRCECYYDAALHKQSTGCQIHDPYEENNWLKIRLEEAEEKIRILAAELALEKVKAINDRLELLCQLRP